MWNGLSTSIPDGWKLCDGTNGTPNLSGRFIVGIGSNGESSYSLGDDDGEDFHQLTVSEMPSHNHGGSTGNDGGHHHIYRDRFYIEHDDQSDMQRDPQEYTDGWNRDFVDLNGSSWAANNGGGEGGVGSEGTIVIMMLTSILMIKQYLKVPFHLLQPKILEMVKL